MEPWDNITIGQHIENITNYYSDAIHEKFDGVCLFWYRKYEPIEDEI